MFISIQSAAIMYVISENPYLFQITARYFSSSVVSIPFDPENVLSQKVPKETPPANQVLLKQTVHLKRH